MRRSVSVLAAFALATCLTAPAATADPAHPARAPTSSSTPTAPPPAVSDADREAARNLYKEGYELQRTGQYADALDRFQRSQAVYPAPTALLHIAECEVQLGRLVAAVEAYRALERQTLAENAPAPFLAAQAQGAAELQQIEPRIPHLLIDVKPTGIPELVVTIDDEPLNHALLDVPRPVDPGEHHVAAVAPGYARVETTVTVAEKDPPKTVPLVLTGAPLPALPPGAPPRPFVVRTAQPYPQPIYLQPTPRYYVRPSAVPTPVTRSGLFFGPRMGLALPFGAGISDLSSRGFSLGGEFDVRFARRLFVGAVVDHGFLATSDSLPTLHPVVGNATFATTNVDAVFGVLTNPDRFGALFQVGAGYRGLSSSNAAYSTGSAEFLLGAGLWIPTGKSFRLVPRVDAAFGSFTGGTGTSFVESGGYAILTVGVGGYFNVDLRPVE